MKKKYIFAGILFFCTVTAILIFSIKKFAPRSSTENSENEIIKQQNASITIDNYYDYLQNKLEKKVPARIQKTNIKEQISVNDEYGLNELKRIQDNKIIGTSIDTNNQNIIRGFWSYNIDQEKVNYYSYPEEGRIWDIVFSSDSTIYYIELLEKDTYYYWYLKSSTVNFENIKVLDEGTTSNWLETPFFQTDPVTNKIIVYTIYETINAYEISESRYKISVLKDNQIIPILENTGNHTTKEGIFAQQAFYTTKIYNNLLIHCQVSYYGQETVELINLNTKEKQIIYQNNDIDNWQIGEIALQEDSVLITFNNKKTPNKARMVSISNITDSKQITEIYMDGTKIIKSLKDNKYIVSCMGIFTIFDSQENKFLYRLDLEGYKFLPTYLSNNNQIVTIDNQNNVYIIYLD